MQTTHELSSKPEGAGWAAPPAAGMIATAAADGTIALGVLGGMGPLATADFLAKVANCTPASCDQDHLPILTLTLPQIPDRSDAIIKGSPSPLPLMSAGVRALQASGVCEIAMPCNTAHFWYDALQGAVSIPIVHIVDAVVEELRSQHLQGARIGLLATDATVSAGVYAERMEAAGYELLLPAQSQQVEVMRAIRSVKAGEPKRAGEELARVVRHMEESGALALVLACTELPLITIPATKLVIIDSALALARRCVERIRERAERGSETRVAS